MAVYNQNIPQPGDDPTSSQTDLLGNFGKLNTDWAINHTPLTSGGNNGFHTKVQFPTVQVSDPVLTGLQSQLYPKTDGNGNTALFFANSAKVFQLTDLSVTNVGTDYGFTTPFGIIFNSGTVPAGTTTVTFAVPFSSNTTVFTVLLTPNQSTVNFVNFGTNTITSTGFTFSTSASQGFNYFAMGT